MTTTNQPTNFSLKNLHDSFILAITKIGQLQLKDFESRITIEKMWLDLLSESATTHDITNNNSQLTESILKSTNEYINTLPNESKDVFGNQLLTNMEQKIDNFVTTVASKLTDQ
ncbi:hypothetical protein KBC75_01470 [Candidatus Shapirobacteria bacterium]|nr:hypothetical protein [Candidatus Shapirobacteria bacterium]